jgi:hypothetical protein
MSRSGRVRLLVLLASIVACSLPPIGPAAATESGGTTRIAGIATIAAPPIAPTKYKLPKGAIWVSNSQQLRAALARHRSRDIVLRRGVYDNSGPFLDPRGNRLYAQAVGTVVLKAGLGLGGNPGSLGGGLVRGISFDVEDRTKTLEGAIVTVWGTGVNSSILDVRLEGHGTIEAGIMARQIEGLVIQRVVAHGFRSYGVLVDTNNLNAVVRRPPLIANVSTSYVSWSPPRSSNGRAEACLWVGNTAVVRRIRAHHCAGAGVWVGSAASGALFEDIRVTDIEIGMYLEHFVRSSTFRRLQIGPGVWRGVTCEWADPLWGSQPACSNIVIEMSWFDTGGVGVYLDAGTVGTTVRSSTFVNQCWAAIANFQGVDNLYDTTGNDYRKIRPGAVPISKDHLVSANCAS